MACTPPPPGRLLLTETDLEALYAIPRKTAQAWRAAGRGPAFLRLGAGVRGSIRYRRASVEAWLAAHERRSTADTGEAAGRPAR